jgi:FkbM family methyltransferase
VDWPVTWRRTLFRRLDRRGLRGLTGLARSAEILLRYREPAWVTYQSWGGWLVRGRGGVTVGPEPNIPPPRWLDKKARDVFTARYAPRPGDVVVDVGAGIGEEVPTLARLVGPAGRLYCVEAHPRTFEFLRRTCELNQLDNVLLDNLAISDAAGEVTISDVGDARNYENSILVAADAGLRVPAMKLAEYFRARQIERVDLLVMNIEGAERPAVAGMHEVADRIRHVAIACHDFLADETGNEAMRTKRIVREQLSRCGFEISERPGESQPWLRDFLYGTRVALEPAEPTG